MGTIEAFGIRLSIERRQWRPGNDRNMSEDGGGLNWSAQHSNLLEKMECEHEAATSDPLFCGPAV